MNVTVYVVIGGYKWEGDNYETVKVFTTEDAARTYGESLLVYDEEFYGTRCDVYNIVTQTITVG